MGRTLDGYLHGPGTMSWPVSNVNYAGPTGTEEVDINEYGNYVLIISKYHKEFIKAVDEWDKAGYFPLGHPVIDNEGFNLLMRKREMKINEEG